MIDQFYVSNVLDIRDRDIPRQLNIQRIFMYYYHILYRLYIVSLYLIFLYLHLAPLTPPIHLKIHWRQQNVNKNTGLCYAEMANLAPSTGSSYTFVYHSAGHLSSEKKPGCMITSGRSNLLIELVALI